MNGSHREKLRFETRNGMLRNILSREVPQYAAEQAESVLRIGLARQGLSREEISGWILHAGGREVLAALRARIGLCEEDTRISARVLSELGNVSSPFVLFVLQAALRENTRGGHWWLASFGAGFSSHGALLQVE